MNQPQNSDNALEWINNYCYIHLDYNRDSPAFHFAFLWNVFETIVCNKDAKFSSLSKGAKRLSDSLEGNEQRIKYVELVESFKENLMREHTFLSYKTLPENADIFLDKYLCFRKNQNGKYEPGRDVVKSLFNPNIQNLELENLILGLSLIAYRIRNNFFHGNKELSSISYQKGLFIVVNNILMTYLDDWRRLNPN